MERKAKKVCELTVENSAVAVKKRIGRVRLVKEAATPFLAGGSRWGPI